MKHSNRDEKKSPTGFMKLKGKFFISGSIRSRILYRTALTFLLFVITPESFGMAWDIKVDLNSPLESSSSWSPRANEIKGHLIPISLGLYSGNYRDGDPPGRFGLELSYKMASPYVENESYSNTTFSLTTFQFCVGRLVKDWGKIGLSCEAGIGFALFSDDYGPGNEDASWGRENGSLLTLGLQLAVPYKSHISGIVSVRTQQYFNKEGHANPFKSGFVASVGIQFG